MASIIDPERNLFRQIADLARTYERPVLILEGRDLYTTQLQEVELVGPKIAQRIRELVGGDYKG